jgi:hypothetical protein
MLTALGFRPHTGWSTVIALASVDEPLVLARERMDLSDPGGPRQAYHAASGEDLETARAVVRRAERETRSAAVRGIEGLVARLRELGHEPVAVALPLGGSAIPDSLERILAAHPLMHAAEGDLTRQAIADAAAEHSLRLTQVPGRDIAAQAGAMLGRSDLDDVLAGLGRALGPPWRKDEREATLLAWLALATYR